ncbi:Peptidase S8, subtilisin-related [Trema orientale]|uniref:Peptidase S8, subtilisin-related n=1 Tax=Trema orientale TaxID=63057 RepID=A0A2P5FYJ2_TREOI|nr:Peptidase S8, subtilisin-related [Trema orientale]
MVHTRHRVDLDSVTSSLHSLLGSYLGSCEKAKDAIFYSYTGHINGFAAVLEEESLRNCKLERIGVIPSQSIWNKARHGEDTIIGNLDSGNFLHL